MKMTSREQNMKGVPDVFGSAENEFGSAKHENGTPMPSVPLKISQKAQNKKKKDLSPTIPPKMSSGA
jgi:hypothetical protein